MHHIAKSSMQPVRPKTYMLMPCDIHVCHLVYPTTIPSHHVPRR